MTTYEKLRKRVGITPLQLLSANIRSIEGAIVAGGMRPADRAAKLVRCAEIALQFAEGDLSSALAQADDRARKRLLERFPGIGDPGVDKVLLISGYSNKPALESNGLRVLERLGVIGASASYATSYRAGVTYLREQAVDAREAFGLLREHGRVLCKRTSPHCPECRLRSICPSAILE